MRRETRFAVSYGAGSIELRLPRDRCRLVKVRGTAATRAPLPAFRESLDHPRGCPPLEELARGRNVTYLIEDATRSEPHEAFMQACLPRLRDAQSVFAVVTTGSHDRLTEGNKRIVEQFRSIASAEGVRGEIAIHDCLDDASLTALGPTPRGTPVEVNARALECDVFLVNSDMKNHYFAGYSCALKDFLPGICSYRAVEANHAMALDPRSTFGAHPRHCDPSRRENPLAQDILDAAELIVGGRPVFVLASVTVGGQALWSAAGAMTDVVAEGIRKVDEVASARVAPCARAIVSPGGDPADETLYNAQRGLELARAVIRPGAEVLFIAACPKGVAPTDHARENFFDRLTAPLDEVLGGIRQHYVLYSHKAYKFATMLKSLSKVYIFTELDEQTVRAAHMIKAGSPQDVVDEWLESSEAPILIVDDANRLALYPERAQHEPPEERQVNVEKGGGTHRP